MRNNALVPIWSAGKPGLHMSSNMNNKVFIVPMKNDTYESAQVSSRNRHCKSSFPVDFKLVPYLMVFYWVTLSNLDETHDKRIFESI